MSDLCPYNFADPAVFAWQSEGQVQAEGVFVLRLSDHLSPFLTGPKFFPALEDEGDEEEADQSRKGGTVDASVFKPETFCFNQGYNAEGQG